jgi:hypothetical protein
MKKMNLEPESAQEIRWSWSSAQEIVRFLGGTLRKTPGEQEYRVRLNGNEYFTDDLQDAVNTARLMAY